MTTATLAPAKGHISPGVVPPVRLSPGEKCHFEPYQLKSETVSKTLAIVSRLALNPDFTSATLRANAGLLMLIWSAKTRIERGQALSRNQAMYRTGMDWRTIKKSVTETNSLVVITENGHAFDFQSGKSKATRFGVIAPEFEFSSAVPVNALMPNHPQWSSHQFGTHGWRLTLGLLSHFGQTPGEFTPAQVRRWTGWDVRQAARVLSKLSDSSVFVARAGHGTYRLAPSALDNTPATPEVPAQIVASETAKAAIRRLRENQGQPSDVSTTNLHAVAPVPDDRAERTVTLGTTLDFLVAQERERWDRELA